MKVVILNFKEADEPFVLFVNDDVTEKRVKNEIKNIVDKWENEEDFWDWDYYDVIEELQEKIGIENNVDVMFVDVNV